jgi:DNA-binding NarL/FixJ family response regulator
MERNLRSTNASDAILIVDTLELRRISIASLLKPWARTSNIDVVEVGPAGALAQPDCPSIKLVVLVIGSQSVSDVARLEWLRPLRTKYPEAPLVFVAERDRLQDVIAAFDCGARGFIPMNVAPQIAIEALKFIIGGGSFFPPAVLVQGTSIRSSASADVPKMTLLAEAQTYGLTVRQQEVLEGLRRGESNKQIAKRLDIGEATVKIHIRQIMRKLGARNRTQAALSAEQLFASRKERGGE